MKGVVHLLLPTKTKLIIGTEAAIYDWDGTTLTELCDYGVVRGHCGDVMPDGTAYIWTVRGVIKLYPLAPVTESRVSVDPGFYVHAKLFHTKGYVKFVASTIAGEFAFNKRTEK